jgi:ParB-like chromosome segregation protein Spo0J
MSKPTPFLPKLELKPIGWLLPYAKNAKKHDEDQIRRLAATIREHGWDQPIVAEPDGTIIKGHGRRLAAIRLGLPEVPVIVRHDLTKAQADGARIADNAAASVAYDTALLQEEIRRLMAETPELDLDSLALTEKDKTLLTEVLDEAAASAVMADTSAEIERQQEEDAERVAGADAEMVPLAKAFGFSRMRASDQRVLTGFMAAAEEATGKAGYDAFIDGLRIAAGRGLA